MRTKRLSKQYTVTRQNRKSFWQAFLVHQRQHSRSVNNCEIRIIHPRNWMIAFVNTCDCSLMAWVKGATPFREWGVCCKAGQRCRIENIAAQRSRTANLFLFVTSLGKPRRKRMNFRLKEARCKLIRKTIERLTASSSLF